jgi:hypothetical protein
MVAPLTLHRVLATLEPRTMELTHRPTLGLARATEQPVEITFSCVFWIIVVKVEK